MEDKVTPSAPLPLSTDALLAEVKAALAQITPWPWRLVVASSAGGRLLVRDASPQSHVQIFPVQDAEFIAHAPAWLAALVALVEEQQRQLSELKPIILECRDCKDIIDGLVNDRGHICKEHP